ncbi:hypothetical protein BN1723_005286 [Verticillium longisporum]|uniref:FAD-dependent oxidoreductase 2 FAD binding domain-containing protein n=1 Tax=Verticillium longisporum TaxID=100787 RepID=A0A0G4N6P2_VERLO|nr:hypothetical protein BN1723_005286 [Verticillium longisporum]
MADVQVQKWQTKLDGLENLSRATGAMPKPGKGEVLVKISAVSLNYRDTEVIMGLYNHHKTVNSGDMDPLVPCSDMCGTVVAVGDDNDNDAPLWAVGDRVLSTFNQAHLTGQIKAPIMASGLGLPLEGTNLRSNVMKTDGRTPFPGLYAAGEVAGFGGGGVHGYNSLEGTFLGGCIFSGRAAGRGVAAELLGEDGILDERLRKREPASKL